MAALVRTVMSRDSCVDMLETIGFSHSYVVPFSAQLRATGMKRFLFCWRLYVDILRFVSGPWSVLSRERLPVIGIMSTWHS